MGRACALRQTPNACDARGGEQCRTVSMETLSMFEHEALRAYEALDLPGLLGSQYAEARIVATII